MSDARRHRKLRIGITGILLSVLLFAMKSWAGIASGSIAVISDALNAFLDMLAYTAAYVSLRIQDAQADENHPFGHRRAEPLAGLLFAVFASVLGATILRDAVAGLFAPGTVRRGLFPALLLVAGIVVKGGMAVGYYRGARATQSPVLRAGYIDSRNDVFSSAVALAGYFGGGRIDDLAALAIGAWIVVSGVRVGLENIGYLMGEAPPAEVLASIRRTALAVPGVQGLNDVRAHYVGDQIHVEVHVEIDRALTLQAAHDIGVAVRRRLEAIDEVHEAFIHIDPV